MGRAFIGDLLTDTGGGGLAGAYAMLAELVFFTCVSGLAVTGHVTLTEGVAVAEVGRDRGCAHADGVGRGRISRRVMTDADLVSTVRPRVAAYRGGDQAQAPQRPARTQPVQGHEPHEQADAPAPDHAGEDVPSGEVRAEGVCVLPPHAVERREGAGLTQARSTAATAVSMEREVRCAGGQA